MTLQESIAAAGWEQLLPAQRATEQPPGPPQLVDALPLGARDGRGLWLSVIGDESGIRYGVPLVQQGQIVRRAQPEEGAAELLLARMKDAGTSGAFRITSWHAADLSGERAVGLEQTNESVIVGERAVVKWVHQLERGPHPAPRILGHLVQSGFTGTPLPWGIVEWQPLGEAAPRLICSADAYLHEAEDGWSWMPDLVAEACLSGQLQEASRVGVALGELLGQFHAALSATGHPAQSADLTRWEEQAQAELTYTLDVLSGQDHALVHKHLPQLRSALRFAKTALGCPLILVHGDLHVGQVLRSAGSYALVDFDGNPVVPPEQRTEPQPAAADVAGLRQSIDHAGLVAVSRHGVPAEAAGEAASHIGAALLRAYRTTLEQQGHQSLWCPQLVMPLRCRQVLREFRYAAQHLPRWSYIPRGALPRLFKETH